MMLKVTNPLCRSFFAVFVVIASSVMLAGNPVRAQEAVSRATEVAAFPTLIGARVLSNSERARLILDLSGVTEFAIVSLSEPNRIAVDVRVRNVAAETGVKAAGGGILANYSVGMVEDGRGRAVLNLSEPAQVQQAYLLEAFDNQPARLVVDLIPDSEAHFAKRVAEDLAAAEAGQNEQKVDLPTAPGQSNVKSGSRPLIVIDPGHGGPDGGADAPNGAKEKNIVLEFARELQRLLVSADRFDVALTRDDDSFLRLEERVAIARENKADLFISIHADTFEDADVQGASIYTRDERATDVLDKVLAENENRADIVAGFAAPDTQANVINILVDLMRREMRRQSYVAAKSMIAHLEPSIRLRKFPLRQADFFVLQAPDVPSILVELGFLSNNEDIANLTAEAWRDRTAEGLARGIAAYFDGVNQN